MRTAIKRVAILTDYLLHPKHDDFLAAVENQALLDLIYLLRDEMNCVVEVYQVSPLKEREFRGIKIRGIDTRHDHLGMLPGLNTTFAQYGLNYDLRIYYHWYLAAPLLLHRSLVVSHGVFWDSPVSDFNRLNPIDREEWRKRHLYGIAAAKAFVVEDRNTANVVKALWPGYEHQLEYLPPGVDLQKFQPGNQESEPEKIRVICPQDFTAEQGVFEILKLGRSFLDIKLPVEFHLIGQMKKFDEALYLAEQVRKLPNMKFDWVPLARLPEVYQQADLALLPSRAAEGASLYCLQAMACGLPVIAGLAGGLSELVVDDWNGKLVKPELRNFQEALLELVQNPKSRLEMGVNSRRLAMGYSLENWKKRWRRLLARVLSLSEDERDGA